MFQTDINSGDFPDINRPSLQPAIIPGVDTELAIIVSDKGLYKCLCRGPIESRVTNLVTGGSGSKITVTGRDRISLMERTDQQVSWRGTEASVVGLIFGKYKIVATGMEDSTLRFDDTRNLLVQTTNDYLFTMDLARRNAFNLWVRTEVVGIPGGFVLVDNGFFRTAPARQRLGQPPSVPLGVNVLQPTLRMNSASNKLPGTATTMNNFTVRQNTEVPFVFTGTRVDPTTGAPIPIFIPGNTASAVQFGGRPIEVVVGPRFPVPTQQDPTPGGVEEAYQRGQAMLVDASYFIHAEATTSRHAACAVIEPNSYINVEGAGGQNSGIYWVDKVTHTLDTESHRMALKLRRSALGVGI